MTTKISYYHYMSSDNEYMRIYLGKRYVERMAKWVKLLGGKCVTCGNTEKLQFDHIDPSTKKFTIAHKWNTNEGLILEELKKCQLLCQACHNDKTVIDKGMQLTKGRDVHGTLAAYRYCKCVACKEAQSEWMKNYHKTRLRCRKKNCQGCKVHTGRLPNG